MTKQEAKELSLEVWQYLAEHPKIDDKSHLPDELFEKIKNLLNWCPLCALFKNKTGIWCQKCPLESCKDGSLYNRWHWASCYAYKINHKESVITIRQKAAQEIVDKIQAWKPEAGNE